MKRIENLVLQGGGVLGTAYAGAYQVLEEKKLAGIDHLSGTGLGNLKRVGGTSAGSIFSTLIAIGYSAHDLYDVAMELDFSKFVDFDKNLKSEGGFVKGIEFYNWISAKILEKFKDVFEPGHKVTFSELAAKVNDSRNNNVFKDLHVFAVNIQTKNVVEFSAATTPNTAIADAVRASMSIPLVFVPHTILHGEYAGSTFVDGGVKYNFPITAFDYDGPNYNTLGLSLTNLAMDFDVDDIETLVIHIVTSLAIKYLQHDGTKKHYEQIELAIETAIKYYKAIKEDSSAWSVFKTADRNKLASLSIEKKWEKLVEIFVFVYDICVFVETFKNAKSSSDKEMAIRTFVGEFGKFLLVMDVSKEDREKLLGAINFVIDFIFSTLLSSNFLPALTTMMQGQQNIVFDRDIQRTIFLDSLGVNFADFWLPRYDKLDLIRSGRINTEHYLQMMMY